jgi:hypothetical protein
MTMQSKRALIATVAGEWISLPKGTCEGLLNGRAVEKAQ